MDRRDAEGSNSFLLLLNNNNNITSNTILICMRNSLILYYDYFLHPFTAFKTFPYAVFFLEDVADLNVNNYSGDSLCFGFCDQKRLTINVEEI